MVDNGKKIGKHCYNTGERVIIVHAKPTTGTYGKYTKRTRLRIIEIYNIVILDDFFPVNITI